MEGKVGLCDFQKHFYVDIYGINKSKFYINIKEAFAMHFAILLGYERHFFSFLFSWMTYCFSSSSSSSSIGDLR